MEPEGSLPHSQVPATCPYPEPAQSSPQPNIPLPFLWFFKCNNDLIVSKHVAILEKRTSLLDDKIFVL